MVTARRRGAALLAGSVVATLLVVAGSPTRAGALTPGGLNLAAAGPPTAITSGRGFILARDGGYPVDVPGPRTLWIFSDTMRFDGSGTLIDGSITGTSAFADDADPTVMWENLQSNGKLLRLLPGSAEPCPPGDRPFAWPTGATGVPQPDPNLVLVVIYYTALCGHAGGPIPAPKHIGVATFWYDATQPDAPVVATVLDQDLFGLTPRYGQAATYDPADGNVYVYGCTDGPCKVGRVFPGSVADPAAYRYWDGSGWVADPGAGVGVAMGGEISQTPSVQWIPQLGRFVAMNFDVTPFVKVRMAPRPEGPWSPATTTYVADCDKKYCITTAMQALYSNASSLRFGYTPMPSHIPRVVDVPILTNPIGALDAVVAGPNTIRLTGWTLDPDVASPLVIGVFIDGVGQGLFTANAPRPDVGASYPGYGNAHGLDLTLAAGVGPHTVCVTARNVGLGTANPSIGCAPVQVFSPPGAPQDPAAVAGDTQVLVTWAPPSDTGGAAPASLIYSVAVSPSVAGSPFTTEPGERSLLVNGLTNGTAYTFTITAQNSAYVGTTSATTSAVTPRAIAGTRFHPMAPSRFLDTRTGAGWSGKVTAGAPRVLQVTGVGGVPSTATAVVMNVTVTESDANSFATASPAGQPVPNASNLNFAVGQTIANLATVKVGTGGSVSFATANGATHVVADVVGWYEAGAGHRFHALLAPTRILDDRNGTGGYSTPVSFAFPRPVAVGGANGVAASAAAVVANTTVTESTRNSFVTLYPSGQALPNASNVNFAAGETTANLVLAKLGSAGRVTVATEQGSVSVIIDATGYFAPT